MQARNNGQSVQPGPCIAPHRAPEAAFRAVIDVKQQPPVRERRVVQRMTRRAPFAKRHQVRAQRIEKAVFMRRQPRPQPCELSVKRRRQVLAPVLRPHLPFRRDRKTQVRAIQLFLNHHLARKYLSRIGG